MSALPFALRTDCCYVRRIGGLIAILCIVLAACSLDKASVQRIVQLDAGPTVQVDSLRIDYTERGRVASTVYAPRMHTYNREGVVYDEFLDGLDVQMFDAQGGKTSMIRAKYAMHWRNRSLWEARYRVVAVNQQGDTMRTEQIFWDQAEHRVYTNALVQVRTHDAILYGRGFESDERFEQWIFREPQGVISVNRPQPPDAHTAGVE